MNKHKAKKSLGQHFLRSSSAIRAIVASANLTDKDTVLEIGPGEGVLTEALLKTGAKVIAVEKDRDLIPILTEKFKTELDNGSLRLILEDVLEFVPSFHKLNQGKYKLVANIPYYITGAIFEKFLTEESYPSTVVVLIQKEVATRIVARDKKESILSLSVKAFGEPKITAKVPRTAFRPAPKVDSAVLAINNVSHKNFDTKESMERFFKIVHAGFAHKRKLLLRNLEVIMAREEIQKIFKDNNIQDMARSENLTLDTWIKISRA